MLRYLIYPNFTMFIFQTKVTDMKKLLSCFVFLITTVCSSAQTTYLADTAFTTDVGFGGAPASCVYTNGYYTGFWMDSNRHYSLADIFTVPFDSTWAFDTVILYGFVTNNSTISTFTNTFLEIYNGIPGSGGSVIWGDMTTNRLVSTGFTGIYRVDTIDGLNYTGDAIMYLKCYLSPAPKLTSGSYWLRWSTLRSGPWYGNCPPKVLPGRINPPGQEGRQDSSGTWWFLANSGHRPGFNKIIKASAGVAAVSQVNNSEGYLLGQNYPNPFTDVTTISFTLPGSGHVVLTVYNAIGQTVASLVNGETGPGIHTLTFDGNEWPAGMYYYQLKTDAGIESRQMLLVK